MRNLECLLLLAIGSSNGPGLVNADGVLRLSRAACCTQNILIWKVPTEAPSGHVGKDRDPNLGGTAFSFVPLM